MIASFIRSRKRNDARQAASKPGTAGNRLDWRLWLALAVMAGYCLQAPAQDTNHPTSTADQAHATNADDTLRSYLELQEQVHEAQLTFERARQESEALAAHNAETLEARLQAIQRSVDSQREQELESMRSSNRIILIVSGLFAMFGILGLLLAALFQWRTVRRLVEISAALPVARAFGAAPSVQSLGPEGSHLMGAGAAAQASDHLLSAVGRLEKRIHQLEQGTSGAPGNGNVVPMLAEAPPNDDNGHPAEPAPAEPAAASETERITLLLAKGQSLLTLDKPQEALACFDDVLKTNPSHAEALVKKGTALERLRKPDQALECYDQAIAADGSLTIAYLYKGGLFHRQEKFAEALKCYDQALQSKEVNQGSGHRGALGAAG